MYGISLLFAITFVGAFLLSAWTIFTYTLPWKCCNRDVLVHELILEVGEDVLSETMKERQKTMLSEKIEDYITKGDWKKCLDIVSDFIEATGKHQVTQNHHRLFVVVGSVCLFLGDVFLLKPQDFLSHDK